MSEDKKGPGRPRSLKARAKILAAARDLLEEGGLGAVTMERVAARAGVGKPTIYRSWPNALSLAMTALMEAQPDISAPDGGASPLSGLRRQLRSVIAAFKTPMGRSAAALIASADANTEVAKAFRHTVILKSRSDGRHYLEEAVAAGEVRGDADLETALDLLYGPVFFRLLLGHHPLEEGFADTVIAMVLSGLRPDGGERSK